MPGRWRRLESKLTLTLVLRHRLLFHTNVTSIRLILVCTSLFTSMVNLTMLIALGEHGHALLQPVPPLPPHTSTLSPLRLAVPNPLAPQVVCCEVLLNTMNPNLPTQGANHHIPWLNIEIICIGRSKKITDVLL